MELSPELRVKVYEYALCGPKDVTLRSPKDLEVRKDRHGQRIRPSNGPSIRNIGILIVSKKVFMGTRPIFYDKNRFHYTILPTVSSVQGVLRHFLMHLHLMQHVSIDYTLHTLASDVSEADRLVSTRVRSVVNGCPNLRTFTLQLLTLFENEELHRGLSASSQTASELSRLAARLEDATYCLDWICIVTHGDSGAIADLRTGITPAGGWLLRLPAEWPGISIDEYQSEEMDGRADGDASQRIRMYYLWPFMRRLVEGRQRRSSAAAV